MREGWRLIYEGYDPAEEPLREVLCTLGNGRFATRGAGEEVVADGVHYPGTYLAGGYNRLTSVVAGRNVINEDLVNFPNWLPLSFKPADGVWLGEGGIEFVNYRQELDLQEGILHREFIARDPAGRETRISSQRFVHMKRPTLAGLVQELVPLNWSGKLVIRSTLDGGVTNRGVARYRQLRGDHIEVIGTGRADDGPVWLQARTKQSRLEVSLTGQTKIWVDSDPLKTPAEVTSSENAITWSSELDAHIGRRIRVEKLVSLRTSRDPALGDLIEDGLNDVRRAPDIDTLLEEHRLAWKRLWNRFDIEVDVTPGQDLSPYPIQLILRLHTFHVLQTASPNTVGLDVSVPARGWTGEAYRGHIFWDEAFVLPLYAVRAPEIARSLLLYRFRRLDEARAAAAAEGYKGAMFPWQSGSSGREETQVIHLNPKSGKWDPDRSHLQRHVNAAIAYNVWAYVCTTDDREFLREYGAELLIEIARFWASLCHWNEAEEQYEIHGVMGPDEFHEASPDALDEETGGLRNNAYTNSMAVWCMQRAVDALQILDQSTREDLSEQLDLSEEELDRWQQISRAMTLPKMETGILEQFEGYTELEELDWDAYREKYGNIGRLDRILKAEGDSPDRYKVSKQPDLCMLFYFLPKEEVVALLEPLGYKLTAGLLRETIEYYRARTSHGSTLSHLVFAAILDEVDRDKAWSHYIEALESDVKDIQGGTTPEGIHTAVMAGTVRHVLERWAGIQQRADRLDVIPRLPKAIRQIRFPLEYRGYRMLVRVDTKTIEIKVLAGGRAPLSIQLPHRQIKVHAGEHIKEEIA